MLIIEILVMLLLLGSIFKFKSILLQLVLLVSFLPLVTLIAFMNDLPVPGVLLAQRNLFSDKTLITSFILLSASNFILVGILFPLRKKIYSYIPFKCTDFSYFLLLCVLLLSAIISYPRVFGFNIDIDMSTIYIATNAALFLCKKRRSSFLSLMHFFILLLVIIGGDRVDSIIPLVFLCLMGNDRSLVIEKISKPKFLIAGIILFLIAVVSGTMRDGKSISLVSIFHSFYAQQTVSDVLYVFLCSVEYFSNYGPDLSVLGNLLFGLFPGKFYGVISDYNYTFYLIHNFSENPGGGLFFSEGMIALGQFGVLLYMTIYAIIIRFLFKNKRKVCVALFILSMIMLCRIQWYGFIYAYKPILFTLIFCLIFITLQKRKNNENIAHI